MKMRKGGKLKKEQEGDGYGVGGVGSGGGGLISVSEAPFLFKSTSSLFSFSGCRFRHEAVVNTFACSQAGK